MEDDIELGNDPTTNAVDEVDFLRENINAVEDIFARLLESNDHIKNAQSAFTMKQIRALINDHLDRLLKLAKQIDKKFVAIVLAHRKAGAADQQDFYGIADDLNQIMRNFQGLRAQMEADQRQVIEARYLAITGEKATSEAIDHLIASHAPGTHLHGALLEQGRGSILEAVAEVEERRDLMMELRRSLINLHQILLGISRPTAAEPPAAMEQQLPKSLPPPSGNGGLNDYEKETRKQAYVAIGIALIINISVVVMLLNGEARVENG